MRRSKKTHNKPVAQMRPAVLYKYLHPGRTDVLLNQKIRFTQPQYLNDPFEVRPVFGEIFDPSDFDEAMSSALENTIGELAGQYPAIAGDKSAQEILRIITRDKAEVMKEDFLKLLGASGPKLEESFYRAVKKKISILSLTENRNNLLMWSHYADQHRGFVVGFVSNHNFLNHRKSESDDLRHPRKVRYSSSRPKADRKTLFNDSNKAVETFFLTKSSEWSYEEEWRVLESVDDAVDVKRFGEEDVCLYDAPHDSISEVIIGARASDELKNMITSMLRAWGSLRHVKLYRAVTSFDNYGLDFKEIRFDSPIEEVVRDLHSPHVDRSFQEEAVRYKNSFEKKMGFEFKIK